MLAHGISTGGLFLGDRRALRAPPHAPARRVRRHLEADADLRRPVPDHRAGARSGLPGAVAASSASSWCCSARSPRTRPGPRPACSATSRCRSCWARIAATGVILGGDVPAVHVPEGDLREARQAEERQASATSTAARLACSHRGRRRVWLGGLFPRPILDAIGAVGRTRSSPTTATASQDATRARRRRRTSIRRSPPRHAPLRRRRRRRPRRRRPEESRNELRRRPDPRLIAPMLILSVMGMLLVLAEAFSSGQRPRRRSPGLARRRLARRGDRVDHPVPPARRRRDPRARYFDGDARRRPAWRCTSTALFVGRGAR